MARNMILAIFLLFQLILLVPSKAYPGGSYGKGDPIDENPVDGDVDEQPKYDDEKPDAKLRPAGVNPNLKEGFYSDSCPKAEQIVADTLAEIAKTNPNAVSNIIRLQFHDCFVVVSFSKHPYLSHFSCSLVTKMILSTKWFQ